MGELTLPLAEHIFDEDAICNLLHVSKGTLAELRLRKQLPTVHLNRVKRVYLAEDVLGWLKSLQKGD